ncbi:insulinase family protein [bacterium]|nr:insulinase family protein [bacterium]
MPNQRPVNEVRKSPNDHREYKNLTLPNQMEVLLVSDPSSDQVAVSLDVLAGQIHDPKDRQGLAHFLEHMLFLGNKKYPEPDGFGKYLSSHGGQSNAYTAYENTNYFFTIQSDYLEGAIDRFAQFFISPLFDFDFVEREINAVNSEHNKNITDDRRRIYRILKHVSNPGHPYSQFGTGNIKTLKGEDPDYGQLRRQLIAYFEQRYSSNLMKLVIVGKDPLSKLEQLAKTHFSPVKNRNLKTESFRDIPLVADELPRKVIIEPVKAMRQLRLTFQMPSYRQYYRHKPSSVVSQLLGDEGKGSVLGYLRNKGWATSLSAGAGFGTRDFSFFELEISLTPEGLSHENEIIATIFQYIELIKKKQDLFQYFKEMKKMAEIGFQFREKEDTSDYARYLASNLQEIPARDVVVSRWLYEDYSPELTNQVLNLLTVDNLQIVLVAPNVKTDRVEKWYGINYSVTKIEKELIDQWKSPGKNDYLALPASNPFIPENIELKQIVVKEKFPVLLKNGEQIRVWFKQDKRFEVPKGNIQVQLMSPLAYSSPKNAAMSRLYVSLLQEHLNEYSYPASTAGLNYSLSNSVKGLVLNISGYSENIPLLLSKIVDAMNSLKIDGKQFQIFKNQIKERRQNQKLAQSFQRITYESYYLISETLWHIDDYLQVIETITIEELEAFIPLLLKQMKIEMLGHGNFSLEEITSIGDLFEANFTGSTPKSVEDSEERTLNVPVKPEFTYQIQVEDVNSAIQILYQAGPGSIEQSAILDLIQQIVEKPFYHQLRTIEQLGYLVWSGYQQVNKVDGFYFIIQSGIKDPVYLQERIESFVKGFYPTLSGLSNDDFSQFKESLISTKLEPPKNLGEETLRYWNEISSGSYEFDRIEKEISALRKLTLDDVIEAYHSIFIKTETEKKISIQAFGKNHKMKLPQDTPIIDVKKFKSGMSFYPNPRGEFKNRIYPN